MPEGQTESDKGLPSRSSHPRRGERFATMMTTIRTLDELDSWAESGKQLYSYFLSSVSDSVM